MEYKKVLVTGSRNYDKYAVIYNALDDLNKANPIIVIHGGADGADSASDMACKKLNIPCYRIPALWSKYGNAAGPIRNRLMLNFHPDIWRVLAFHDELEKSKGTLDMILLALEKAIPVFIYENGKVREIEQLSFNY